MLDYLRPGAVKQRDKFNALLNTRAGEGNWFWAFQVNGKLYSWDFGMQLYEDAYWSFLRSNVNHIKKLVSYSDVYVFDNKDLNAGLDYRCQEQRKDHLQDIAIRRCLVRFGVWFKGKKILNIPESEFDDTKVKFHLKNKSIRSWYNSSRVVVIAASIEDQIKLSKIMVK